MKEHNKKIKINKNPLTVVNCFTAISMISLVLTVVILLKINHETKISIDKSHNNINKIIDTEGSIIRTFSNFVKSKGNNNLLLAINDIAKDQINNIELLQNISINLRKINSQNQMSSLFVVLLCMFQTTIMFLLLLRISHKIAQPIKAIRTMINDSLKGSLGKQYKIEKGVCQELFNDINISDENEECRNTALQSKKYIKTKK